MDEIEQPDLRGEDKHGNVRPADDRFLTKAQQRKRDAFVTKVEEAKADAETREAPEDDPLAEVLQAGVDQALASAAVQEHEVTPVTSARGDNPEETA